MYKSLVTEPLLNLLQFFQNLTGDIGWAIFLLGVVVNLALWPIYVKSYVNSQKMRLLQPEIKKLQEKYKDDKQTLFAKQSALLKSHKVNGSFAILALLIQLPIFFGLYRIIDKVVRSKQTGEDLINNDYDIYSFVNSDGVANFGDTAFGVFDITQKVAGQDIKWYLFPLATAMLMYFSGLMMKKSNKALTPVKKDRKEGEAPTFAESIQDSMSFNITYVMPIGIFLLNVYILSFGLNIYFLAGTMIGFLRQLYLTMRFANRPDMMMEAIAESDPMVDKPKSRSKRKAKPGETQYESAGKVVDVEAKPKVITKKKSKAAKKKAAKSAAVKRAVSKKASSNKKDDLTKVEGIGKVINKALNKAGIKTFDQLSKASQNDIQEAIKDVRGKHVSDTWGEQAKLAGAGKWDELDALQDELVGGIRQ